MSDGTPSDTLCHRLLAPIRGDGIEIGAYHSPMPVAGNVRYVDLLTSADASVYYPEASAGKNVVSPDIIAKADALPMLEDASQDFVLHNGLMEHLPDPIRGLKEWHRILRSDGWLLIGLPDKRYTFDHWRSRTTLGHLIADHRAGERERALRDREHYREWSRWVSGLHDPAQMQTWADLLRATDYPIHYHCWIPDDLRELIHWLADAEGVRFTVEDEAIVDRGEEFAFLLRARKD